MKIEEGKFYRTRDGRKVGPVVLSLSSELFGLAEGPRKQWYPNGRMMRQEERSGDLVAEWTDESTSPVRTVTRKEIVPGVYGRLKIDHAQERGEFGDILVALCSRSGRQHEGLTDPAYMTVAELREAAATFNEIADALSEVSP